MNHFKTKRKVFAYITRMNKARKELLVFEHRDFPEAGIQVPAGTVEASEILIDALLREVEEESGLTTFSTIQFLGNQEFIATAKKEIHQRYFYHLTFEEDSPNTFQHIVTGTGEDEHLVFDYLWLPLNNLPKLIANHDGMISFLKGRVTRDE